MNLSIDSTACISCGMCEERLPAVFHIDRTQRSAVILRQPTRPEQDDALEGAGGWPPGGVGGPAPEKT